MDQMTIWMFGSGRLPWLPCLELKCTFSILVHKVHNFNIIHFHILNITHLQYYIFAHFQYYTLSSQYVSRSGGRKRRPFLENWGGVFSSEPLGWIGGEISVGERSGSKMFWSLWTGGRLYNVSADFGLCRCCSKSKRLYWESNMTGSWVLWQMKDRCSHGLERQSCLILSFTKMHFWIKQNRWLWDFCMTLPRFPQIEPVSEKPTWSKIISLHLSFSTWMDCL